MTRRYAISNIAWPAEADEQAVAAAARLGFSGIEIAPSKLFGPWADIRLSDVAAYREKLADRGLAIPAMQAILFGRSELRLFGDQADHAALRDHLTLVARIAAAAGAYACVFGSPKQRDPGDRPTAQAMEEAAAFFRTLAPVFAAEGCALAFEANVPAYGCRFVTRTEEAIELVGMVGHPAFKLQLDLGTVTANEEPMEVVARAVPHAAHLHISEPALAPVGSAGTDHSRLASTIAAAGWDRWLSVEMTSRGDWPAEMHAAHRALGAYAAPSPLSVT